MAASLALARPIFRRQDGVPVQTTAVDFADAPAPAPQSNGADQQPFPQTTQPPPPPPSEQADAPAPAPQTEAPAPAAQTDSPAPAPQTEAPVPQATDEPAPASQTEAPAPAPQAIAEIQAVSGSSVAHSGDPCADIDAILARYGPSNSPQDATNLHNEIRAYTASYMGITLQPYTWSDDIAAQASYDAQYSVSNSDCTNNGLAHAPDFGPASLKSLGFATFTESIALFTQFGNPSECHDYFDSGIIHFGNIAANTGRSVFACAAASCPGGYGGQVVGCDYA
ncbi:hypothetical protein BC830DRAFT_1105740 [Chytriomyces sp. MP71]|nr:hypothetical protein BC830DRAFT_1105740 [Chytriomyces sp. MP71]